MDKEEVDKDGMYVSRPWGDSERLETYVEQYPAEGYQIEAGASHHRREASQDHRLTQGW